MISAGSAFAVSPIQTHMKWLRSTTGEQRSAMRTAIIEGNDIAALAAVKQHILAEQRPAQQFAVDQLVIQSRNVPTVFEKHAISPAFSSTRNVSPEETRFLLLYCCKRIGDIFTHETDNETPGGQATDR